MDWCEEMQQNREKKSPNSHLMRARDRETDLKSFDIVEWCNRNLFSLGFSPTSHRFEPNRLWKRSSNSKSVNGRSIHLLYRNIETEREREKRSVMSHRSKWETLRETIQMFSRFSNIKHKYRSVEMNSRSTHPNNSNVNENFGFVFCIPNSNKNTKVYSYLRLFLFFQQKQRKWNEKKRKEKKIQMKKKKPIE